MISLDELRAQPVLAGLSDEDLQWFLDSSEEFEFDAEAVLFQEGSAADQMCILVEGTVQVRVNVGGQLVPMNYLRAGSVSGLLPYSRLKVYAGEGVAVDHIRGLLLHRDHFPEMLQRMPVLGERLVGVMSDRVRELTRLQQQREKLMALGKLSAGLAHELNNPAAATRRAAGALREMLASAACKVAGISAHGLGREMVETVVSLREAVSARPPEKLTTLQRSEKEDEVTSWLDEHNVEDSWQLAPSFVESGITVEDLDAVAATVPETALEDMLIWMEALFAADRLLKEINSATSRMSELVASIKTYSHMDRAADLQPVDVSEGIDSTLVMLGHKIRKKNIRVVREYHDGLPLAPAIPGELNQVWTNLIDNAIDAMDDGGVLRIEARRERDSVRVDVIDNGKGIPPEIQTRVFEPFFTTKPVGEGTGLGLDLVHRIITRQHGGEVSVESQPGHTVFSVWLQLRDTAVRNGAAEDKTVVH